MPRLNPVADVIFGQCKAGRGVIYIATIIAAVLVFAAIPVLHGAEVAANQKNTGAATASKSSEARERGIEAFEKSDVRRGYEILEPLAAAGDSVAKFYIAFVLARPYFRDSEDTKGILAESNFTGLPIDLAKGLEFLKQSAASEYPHALSYLGLLHLTGKGVEKDESRFLALMHRAANVGGLAAYNALGMHFLESDPATAYRWHFIFYNCKNYSAAAKTGQWQAFKSIFFPSADDNSATAKSGKEKIRVWTQKHGKLCPGQNG